MSREKFLKAEENAEEKEINQQEETDTEIKEDFEEIIVKDGKPATGNKDRGIIFEKIGKACLYLLAFLTPFFFLPLTTAPVEANKQFLALTLVLVAFFCYLIRCINARKIFYPKSFLSLGVLGFLLVAVLGSIFSQARTASIYGDFSQPDTLLSFLIYGLAFFLASVFIKKNSQGLMEGKFGGDWEEIGFCFLGGLIIAGLFGSFQIFGKFIFPWAFAKQANFNTIGSVFGWGVFITSGLVGIIATLINFNLRKSLKITLWVCGLFVMLILAVLNYQLLWIGLALAMFLLIAFKFAEKSEMTLPLIILVISLFFILINQHLPVFVSTPTEVRPSFGTTLTIAKGTLTGVKQFIFGSGPATFGYDYSRFRPVELNMTSVWSYRFTQGFSFLTTLVSSFGILGISAILFFVYCLIRQGLKSWSDKKSTIIIAIVSFLAINLFIYPAFFTQLLFVFLGLGVLAADSEKSFEMGFWSDNKLKNIYGIAAFIGMIILFSFGLFVFYLIGQKYIAAIYYARGVQAPTLEQSANLVGKAANMDPQSDKYLRGLSQVWLMQAGQLAQMPAPSNAADTTNLQNQYQNTVANAINAARDAIALNPVDFLNWSNLGNVYEQVIPIQQADVLAEQNYNKAIDFNPKDPQGYVDLARVLVISADQSQKNKESQDVWQKKLDDAGLTLNKSIALKPDFEPAYFLIAQIYIREGNLPKAIEKVEQMKALSPTDAGLAFELGFLYYQANQLDKAQAEFERAVSLSETYSNARYFLGLIYDKKGREQDAIAQFERVAQLNPDNQEVKNILANLKAGKTALQGITPPPEKRNNAPIPEASQTQP